MFLLTSTIVCICALSFSYIILLVSLFACRLSVNWSEEIFSSYTLIFLIVHFTQSRRSSRHGWVETVCAAWCTERGQCELFLGSIEQKRQFKEEKSFLFHLICLPATRAFLCICLFFVFKTFSLLILLSIEKFSIVNF